MADPNIHLTFLTDLLSRIDTNKSKEAHVLLLATIANAKLLYGDFEGAKTDMDEAWKILDHMTGVDDGVNAAYYGVAAAYYKVSLTLREGKVGIDNRSIGESGVCAILQELAALPGMCRY